MANLNNYNNRRPFYIMVGMIFSFGVLILVGCPPYNVWRAQKQGEAQLAEAMSNRQIAIQEAHAKMEAAKDLAQAEVIRAEGIAKANKIIGQSLENNKAYLDWLWIDQLEKNNNAVIYVPTEANLPILEANRLRQKVQMVPAPEGK